MLTRKHETDFCISLRPSGDLSVRKAFGWRKSDGENEEGDVQLNDPAELENDDDSIDENIHDARARRVRTIFMFFFFVFVFLFSLSLIKERLTKFLPGHH